MKKRIVKILLIAFVTGLVLYKSGGINLASSTVRAVGGLHIDWGIKRGNKLFNFKNIAPGFFSSKIVKITNDTGNKKSISVKGKEDKETGNLSDVIYLTISYDGKDIYGGGSGTGRKTLSQFFTESKGRGGLKLGNTVPRSTKNMAFKVDFDTNAGNEYQGKKLVFDLSLGFSSKPKDVCKSYRFHRHIRKEDYKKIIERLKDRDDLVFDFDGEENHHHGGCYIRHRDDHHNDFEIDRD